MSVRKLLIAAGLLVVFAWIWSRVRGDAEVDVAPPQTPASANVDDAVSAAVGTPPPLEP
ncbi:MAG: hypothetical protein ABR591_02905 [Candidatus Velthaea sp.]